MPTWIGIVDGIIITIAIQIQPIEAVGIEISRIIRRDESSPFGAIVTRIEIVQAGILVVIVTAISDGILGCNTVGIERNRAITPSIISIAANLGTIGIINTNDVTKQIAAEVVGSCRAVSAGIHHADDAGLGCMIKPLNGSMLLYHNSLERSRSDGRASPLVSS